MSRSEIVVDSGYPVHNQSSQNSRDNTKVNYQLFLSHRFSCTVITCGYIEEKTHYTMHYLSKLSVLPGLFPEP